MRRGRSAKNIEVIEEPRQPEASPMSTPARGRPTIICLTPVRNEAWTLRRMLRCAELWADHIIVADQGSTDGTREIAREFEKVTLVENPGAGYDEGQRHRVILEAARSIEGPRVIVAVDADEALSANVVRSDDWQRAMLSPPGTILTADWINYLPGLTRAWIPRRAVPIGLVDDARPHNAGRLHVERIVVREDDPKLSLDPVKLLHFQHVNWNRMKSKQRRYQCLELVARDSRKRPVQIYRQYHRMDAIPRKAMIHPDPEWISGYERRGIDMRSDEDLPFYSGDEEVLEMLTAHGPARFRRVDVWDVDWRRIASEAGSDVDPSELNDPRSRWDKALHRWLAETQRRDPDRWTTRLIQRALAPLGW